MSLRRHIPRPPTASGPRGRRSSRRTPVAAALLTGVAMLAAACGGGGDGSDAEADPSASAGSPKTGGTLTFAEYTTPTGMDPIVNVGTGSNGLVETTAVFDTLLRYNHDSGEYDPGTAESATANADSTVWTIKLRPGIRFTDGTDYDAEAVVFGINRHRSGTPGAPDCATLWACPSNTTSAAYGASFIADATAVDKTTVRITLKRSWPTFPSALASETGLIPSPTALKKCDPAAPVSQCSFNTAPVGAGPFMVTSFKPGEVITMVRNPDYWGGQVYLDGLRFIDLKDGGGLNSLNAVKTDQAQAAYLRDQAAIAQAHDDKMPGLTRPQYAGSVLRFNTTTAPTSDVRIRQAVALAVDPDVVNQRAFDGKGTPSNQFLPSSFRFSPDAPAPKVDPEAAKKLIAEAKAAGWDGRIRLTTGNAPAATNIGLAIQAMLQNVGMTVTLDNGQDASATTAKLFKKDYQLLVSGLAIFDDDSTAVSMASYYTSTSTTNRTGVSDPGLDKAMDAVLSAGTEAEKRAAYGEAVRQLDEVRPDLPLATFRQMVVTSPKVHGLVLEEKDAVYLDKAWLG